MVLLAPVWHEWRDGGFRVAIVADDIKHRNVQRNSRASIVVAENGGRNRGIEVRGIAHIVHDSVDETTQRITLPWLGRERTALYLQGLEGIHLVHVLLEPGTVRVWDFADERHFTNARDCLRDLWRS